MKLFKSILLVTCLSAPAAVFAADGGLFIEPGVTFQKIDTEANWGSTLGSSTGSNDGLGVSARLGFHINEAFFAGLDARYAFTKFKDSAVNTDVSAKSMDFAPVIGIQMPDVGVRLWAGYVLAGTLDPDKVTDSTISYDAKLSEAKGYRIGAGFRVAMVSLNLEYQDLKYGKSEADTFLGSVNLSDDISAKGFIAGISFPLEL